MDVSPHFLATDILSHSYENGIITFLSGILFVLCIYHLILYFQQGILSYLFYSIYVLFLFFSIAPFSTDFLMQILHPEKLRPFNTSGFTAELAFVTYFFFMLSFLNLKKHNPLWHKIILHATYFLGGIVIVFELLFMIIEKSDIALLGYEITMIYLTPLLAILSYIPILKLKTPLKYYIIIGSLLVFFSSVITDAMSIYSGQTRLELSQYYSAYFICIVIENCLFSLGLGHKQKLILEENRNSQEKIISQYKENEKLKEAIQKQLEENLELISKKAEKEEIKRIKANYEKELAELKITALKSQMNPHFIFNSLNSIKLYIIDNDKDNAVYYLNKFSKLIRKILASTRVKKISLEEELDILKLYVGIENIRFENKINLKINIDPNLDIETVKLPSLILQPFLENAIWHGLPSKRGEKILRVELYNNSPFLKIIIEDNGIGRVEAGRLKNQKVHGKKSIGIELTKERLRIFSKDYKNDYSLEFIDLYDEDEFARGTRVSLNVPLD